jgi:membrane protease YdiL (CAAX protease family)
MKTERKHMLLTLLAIVGAVVITTLVPLAWQPPAGDPGGVLLFHLLGFAFIVAPAVLLAIVTKTSPSELGFRGHAVAANVFGVITALLFFLVFPLFLKELSFAEITAYAVLFELLPAVFEEFLFRGFLQGRLSAAWGKWKAFFITAAVFAFFHFPQRIISDGYDPAGALVSCIFLLSGASIVGTTRMLFKNIYAGIWLHFMWNIALRALPLYYFSAKMQG